MRRHILERNGYTCQVCGAGAGEESLCESGKKCRLEIDHIVPISQGGTDEEHNLRAVCVWYNKDKSNLKVPTSRDAISAMALIRRQPRDVLTCPENPEPVVMRVFGVQGTQEALDEAEEARSGRDHQEVA